MPWVDLAPSSGDGMSGTEKITMLRFFPQSTPNKWNNIVKLQKLLNQSWKTMLVVFKVISRSKIENPKAESWASWYLGYIYTYFRDHKCFAVVSKSLKSELLNVKESLHWRRFYFFQVFKSGMIVVLVRDGIGNLSGDGNFFNP